MASRSCTPGSPGTVSASSSYQAIASCSSLRPSLTVSSYTRRSHAAAHAQPHHHGQVVGGDTREAAPVDVEGLALELHVPVDPVEPEDREDGRVRSPHAPHR